MKAGDTILVEEPGTSYDSHLWMVINDPNQSGECLIVNFTSWRADKDQACVIEVKEHPYIRHKSCVNFSDAKLVPAAKLEECLCSGRLVSGEPLSPLLLEKIRAAVGVSKIRMDFAQLLIDQGLVSLD